MKPIFKTFLFLFVGHYAISQDSAIVLSARMFSQRPVIRLASLNGWLFKEGNNISWANGDVDTAGWIKLKPTELSAKYADQTGRAEGWFRLQVKPDNDFHNVPIGIRRGSWAATDIFIDGTLIASFGSTGTSGKPYKEYNPIDKLSVPVTLEPGKVHSIVMHFVDHLSPFPSRMLKSQAVGVFTRMQGLNLLVNLTGPGYDSQTQQYDRETLLHRTSWLSITALLALLFWLLVFQNPDEKKNLLLIAVYTSFSALSNLCRFFFTDPDASFTVFRIADITARLCFWFDFILTFIIVLNTLNFKIHRKLTPYLITFSFLGCLTAFFDSLMPVPRYISPISFIIYSYIIISSLKKIKGARWAIVVGLFISSLLLTVINLTILFKGGFSNLLWLAGYYLSFPLALLVYVSMRFREIIRDVRANAQQIVLMTEEKNEQALNQQAILEEQVKDRTAELSQSLGNLKATQAQLIQSEKMASLGELTAGIAHEIQNPLNFVNNFSEVNRELIEELKSEKSKVKSERDDELETQLLSDIEQNLEKINHHGKRADAIVKGMLQHSRSSSGIKEPTDINALCDEYLRLAYHGMRAKDKSFNAITKTEFDNSIGKINVVPQEIGRVVLNLINNAFYTVDEKKKHIENGYDPTVSISTKKNNGKVEIKVADNGNGIPQKVLDKIFQPFFTTKPTGEGTGLGLSLSYDIITKGHGGQLKVETKEGEGSEFIIQLPRN
jgi:signal transduction histidine kinase